VEFNFKQFTRIPGRSCLYSISIRQNYTFGFNSRFFTKEHIIDTPYVMLYYDENKKLIGFYFSKNKISNSYKINIYTQHGYLKTPKFFEYNKINIKDIIGAYEPKKYNDPKIGEIFYIQLKEDT